MSLGFFVISGVILIALLIWMILMIKRRRIINHIPSDVLSLLEKCERRYIESNGTKSREQVLRECVNETNSRTAKSTNGEVDRARDEGIPSEPGEQPSIPTPITPEIRQDKQEHRNDEQDHEGNVPGRRKFFKKSPSNGI